MTAGEIAGRFGCTWPTTSRHLGLLVTAGLLDVEKQGRTRIYKVNTRKFQAVQEWFAWFGNKEDAEPAAQSTKKRAKAVGKEKK